MAKARLPFSELTGLVESDGRATIDKNVEDLLTEQKLVEKTTAVHSTTATSAAPVAVTCADGTRIVEGWCETSFNYRRDGEAGGGNTHHDAGKFEITMVCDGAARTLSIRVTSGSNTELHAQPMGVA